MAHIQRDRQANVIVYIVVVVNVFTFLVSGVLVVALNWLGAQVWLHTIGITVLIGYVLFLNPIIPGSPFYIFSGILVTSFYADGKIDGRFWIGIAISCIISFGVKITSSFIQQVVFGTCLKQSVSVRAFCQIDSAFMRTIRYILTHSTPHHEKILVLLSGPDWPTSVLSGIMDVPVKTSIIYQLPVIILIFPPVVAGGLQVISSDPLIATLAEIIMVFTFMQEIGLILFSILYVSEKSRHYRDVLVNIPIDDEVVAYRLSRERKIAQKHERTLYTNLSSANKVYMYASFLTGLIAIYVSAFADGFKYISLNNTTNHMNLRENATPAGIFSLITLFVSGVLHFCIVTRM